MGAPWIMSWSVLVDSACEASVLQAQQLLQEMGYMCVFNRFDDYVYIHP